MLALSLVFFGGEYMGVRMMTPVVENVAGITSILSFIYMTPHDCVALD